MNKRSLGNTGLQITELGYGCASLWGKSTISDSEAEALFMAAYDHGIRFFDTCYSYGCAEQRLGQCLKKLSPRARHDIVISTKCGTRKTKQGKYVHDWSVEWLKKSIQISLKRLGIDYIDLLHVHGPSVEEITPEMIGFLNQIKRRGIAKAIGVNTFDTSVIEWVADSKSFDFVMLDYNILRQDREGVIRRLYENGIGVIAGAPLAQSLYSNRVYKIRSVKDIWYFLRALKNFRGQMIEGKKFRFINEVPGYSGNQLALRYVLDNKYVSSAVFGSVTMDHLIENTGAVDIFMPDDVRVQIRTWGNRSKRLMDRR